MTTVFSPKHLKFRAKSYEKVQKADTSSILNETIKRQATDKQYDIFLSHSIKDAEIILGLKLELEDLGYKVYVDWDNEPNLDRSCVSPQTANILRERMRQSQSLFYAVSENSSFSKWMPWELGFFDGYKGTIAIIPITDVDDPQKIYEKQEYLGLYPYVDKYKNALYVQETLLKIVPFDNWLKGEKPSYQWVRRQLLNN